jgi:Fcf2 pre-rRNA processing
MVLTRKQRQESESETEEEAAPPIATTKTKAKPKKQEPIEEHDDESEPENESVVNQQVDDRGEPDDDETDEHKRNVKQILLDLKQEKLPKGHSQQVGNSLTALIPGYIAPMKLESSSATTVSLSALRKEAGRTDKSTKNFVVGQVNASHMIKPAAMPSKFASFKTGTKKPTDLTAGAGWFHMQPTVMTDAIKTDLAMIRHRTYLDPKRFYKKSDLVGNVLQVGTVIEGAAEFYSSRLANKERRQTLTAEIMADPATADYAKRKLKKMQQEKSEAGRKTKKRKPNKAMRRGY